MTQCHMILLFVVAVVALSWGHVTGAQHKPEGKLVYAMHVTIAPAWFDPADNGGLITPFAVLYALHDGVVRPMPGEKIGNSLAEAWTESPEGLMYEFKLRPGLRFHNGEPCTAFRRLASSASCLPPSMTLGPHRGGISGCGAHDQLDPPAPRSGSREYSPEGSMMSHAHRGG